MASIAFDYKKLKPSFIGFAAAIVLIAAVGAYYIVSPAIVSDTIKGAEANHHAQRYTDAANIEAKETCQLVSEAAQVECVNQVFDAYRDKQREEYDLEAQRQAAVWTRATGIAAIAAFVVSVFGVLMVFATFREAQKQAAEIKESVKAAERSASAMEDVAEAMGLFAEQMERSADASAEQAEISRDAAVRQLRPYLAIAKTWVEEMEAGKKLVVVCDLRNTGLTPAKKVVAGAGVLVPQPLKNHGVPDIPMATKDARFELGSGRKIRVYAETKTALTNATVSQFESGATQIYVRLTFDYEDVFGHMRRSEFLFRSTGRDDVGFEPCGGEEHNYSD